MNIEKGVDYTKKTYHKALSLLGEEKAYQEEPLLLEDIVLIHDDFIKEFGGSYGVRDENLLNSVQMSPYQSCFGEDLYPSLFDKAAKLLLDFCRYQIFVDGNKRTGIGTCSVFLYINDYRLALTNEEAYQLAMDIANDKVTEITEVSAILKENSIALVKDVQEEREDTVYERE